MTTTADRESRPGAVPFVIGLWQLLNAEKHQLGPFEPVRKSSPLSRNEGDGK